MISEAKEMPKKPDAKPTLICVALNRRGDRVFKRGKLPTVEQEPIKCTWLMARPKAV